MKITRFQVCGMIQFSEGPDGQAKKVVQCGIQAGGTAVAGDERQECGAGRALVSVNGFIVKPATVLTAHTMTRLPATQASTVSGICQSQYPVPLANTTHLRRFVVRLTCSGIG